MPKTIVYTITEWAKSPKVVSGADPFDNSITPLNLIPSVGPLILTIEPETDPMLTFDARFDQFEPAAYAEFLSSAPSSHEAMHYGGVMGRLQQHIRRGLAYGIFDPDGSNTYYDHGRQTVKKRLTQLDAASVKYSTKPENITGHADVEAFWLLEADQRAYNCLWANASQYSQQDKYQDLTGTATSIRQALIPLRALGTAHRLGIPFQRATPTGSAVGFDGSQGSWQATAERQLKWIFDRMDVCSTLGKGLGYLPSTAHSGREPTLFNAWAARVMLEYCRDIEFYVDLQGRSVFGYAKALMDHIIEKYNDRSNWVGTGSYGTWSGVAPAIDPADPADWETLPYLESYGVPAYDLAGFYVMPAMILWQETADVSYRDFATSQIRATRRAGPGVMSSAKQFNQVYSMHAFNYEALLNGVNWRPNLQFP